MPKLIPVLLAACLLVAAGCKDEKEFSRYPSVMVPEYGSSDYNRDLSDRNPEVVYNAVCNLGIHARRFGESLGGEKADPTSEGYRTAKDVYQKVLPLLQAREPQLVAASLRFLQLFSEDYKPKTELIAPISQVQSAHPLVQFEQVAVLSLLVTNTTRLPAPLLRGLLASPSWIVSRQTYALVDQLRDATLRAELVRRYHSTTEERERLLLLTAFYHAPGPAELELLKHELLTSANPKLRQSAGRILAENLELPGLVSWINSHYSQLQLDDRTVIFQACDDSDVKSSFLAQGYVPTEGFLERLSHDIDEEAANRSAHTLQIEKAVQAAPALAADWQKLRADCARASAQFTAIEKEYTPLARAFLEQSRAVFSKHKVPAEKQNKFIGQIPALNRLDLR